MTIEAIKPLQISRRGLLTGGLALGGASAIAGPASAAALRVSPEPVGPIYRAINAADMSMIEQEHVPQFLAPDMAIRGRTVPLAVQAGSRLHPMEEDHWIGRIRLLDDKGHLLTDMTLSRTGTVPGCELYLRLDKTTTFVAQTFCNQHGIWEARHQIAV